MKKSVLQDLYLGNITPWEQRPASDPEYGEIMKALDEEERHISGELPEWERERFRAYKNLIYQAVSMDEVEIFKIGYKLGSLMVMEVLGGKGVSLDG